MSHTYECEYLDDYDAMQQRVKSKDIRGNNIMHDICMLPQTLREEYFEIINDNHVNIHFDPTKRNVKVPAGMELKVCLQAGDFRKRNRLSLLPHELVHRQPFATPSHVV